MGKKVFRLHQNVGLKLSSPAPCHYRILKNLLLFCYGCILTIGSLAFRDSTQIQKHFTLNDNSEYVVHSGLHFVFAIKSDAP